jgi:hypothetical protein
MGLGFKIIINVSMGMKLTQGEFMMLGTLTKSVTLEGKGEDHLENPHVISVYLGV